MTAVIQVKRGTASSWTSVNTVLAAGEIGFESDTKKMKVGDGSTAWTSLAYTATDGDITAVVAGTGLSGGSTSGSATLSIDTATTVDKTTAQTLTNKTLTSPVLTTPSISTMTTAGDILYASSANTPARLGIGSTGQNLVVASGVPSWATPASSGSMTSLATGTLTGATPTISSISGAYNHLELWVQDPYGSGANIWNMRINSNSGGVYNSQLILSSQSPTVRGQTNLTSFSTYNGMITSANQNGWWHIKFPFYSLTTTAKAYSGFWCRAGNSDAAEQFWGSINDTNAITSISFFLDGGSTFTGGDYILYGVK